MEEEVEMDDEMRWGRMGWVAELLKFKRSLPSARGGMIGAAISHIHIHIHHSFRCGFRCGLH